MFTISHKKVNKPFVVLKGGNVKNTSGVDIKKMQPPLSGHPRGTGKGPLNGGWPLNRGSYYIIFIFLYFLVFYFVNRTHLSFVVKQKLLKPVQQ